MTKFIITALSYSQMVLIRQTWDQSVRVHYFICYSLIRRSPERRYDGERLPVLPVDDWPGVEVGIKWLLKVCVVEGEEVSHVPSIIKRHLTTSIVQINPNILGGLWRMYQVLVRVGARLVLADAIAFVPPHQRPETVVWAEADLVLSVDGGPGYAQTPRRLAAHLHLPVVPARGEGFRAQDDVVAGEALGVVGQVGLQSSHLDTGATRRHPEAGVGCVWVKGHR